MADNGRWFKLWTSSPDDPDLDNLDIADFGRWAKLGAVIKEHGKRGVLIVESPARSLCAKMQVSSFEELEKALRRMPNLNVVCVNGKLTVTFNNWIKYQEDTTVSARVKKWREGKKVTGQEEKRGEEKRREEINTLVEKLFGVYPFRNGKKVGRPETVQAITDNVKSEEYDLLLQATKNFAANPDAKKGVGVKDLQRFIISGRGDKKYSPWKEWIDQAPKQGDPGLGNPNAGRDPGL